jgi:hypothetical protein
VKVFKISDQQILTDARKYLNLPIIDSKRTPTEMANKIVSITKKAIEEFVTLFGICK